jgi:Na+-translocating ferredoxin:NAD+ oxidoreductase RnfD subunit
MPCSPGQKTQTFSSSFLYLNICVISTLWDLGWLFLVWRNVSSFGSPVSTLFTFFLFFFLAFFFPFPLFLPFATTATRRCGLY